jgi:3-dehydroquinate dehydratase II
MKPLYVLNGPNLNMLGHREPAIYGADTLETIERRCKARAATHGLDIVFRQSNIEGELVGLVQEARDKASGIALNAGAYTHTSVALHDALKATGLPAVEVHLSNIHKREEFRHKSYVAPAVNGIICGFGANSYELAIDALAHILQSNQKA